MDIVLIGAPGAGKGTQAEKLAPLLTSRHIASGDLFRKAFEEQSELGIKAQKYVDLGELVPDEITIPMVIRHIEEPESMQGVLLDGFPRTLAQAQELDAELERINRQIDLAVYLKVSREEILQRLAGRRIIMCTTSNFIRRKRLIGAIKMEVSSTNVLTMPEKRCGGVWLSSSTKRPRCSTTTESRTS